MLRRLINALQRQAIPCLVLYLFSLGLSLPFFSSLHLSFMFPAVCLYTGCTVLVLLLCRALPKFRWLPPLLLVLSQVVLFYLARQGIIQVFLSCWFAIQLWLRGTDVAIVLYADSLAWGMAVLAPLLFHSTLDMDTSPVLTLTLSAMYWLVFWVLGIRAESWMVLPAVLAILLQTAFSRREGEQPLSLRNRLPGWAVCLALVAAGFLLTPRQSTPFPPLSQAAQQVRQYLEDTFSVVPDEGRHRYTLADDGWMPLGENRVGGRPSPSSDLVMRVKSDGQTVYLRGAVYDRYTGLGWENTLGSSRYNMGLPIYSSLKSQLFQMDYPLAGTQQSETVQVDLYRSTGGTLFVPHRFLSLNTPPSMIVYFNDSAEIYAHRDAGYGDSYTVTYLPMRAVNSGMDSLATACAAVEDPEYSRIAQRYTALPGHLQNEIVSLVQQLTWGAATPWAKAIALRDYLQSTFSYSLDVQPPPDGVDFTSWFLLGPERAGYCTYFATAYTVMLRLAGLPARYVEGYCVHASNPAAEDGYRYVYSYHGHAWTEVYLSGLGWVIFDATPSLNPEEEPDDTRSSSSPSPSPQASPSPSPEPQPSLPPEDPPATPSPEPTETPEQTPTPTPEMHEQTPPPSDPPEETQTGEYPPPLSLLWLLLLLPLLALALLLWRLYVTDPLHIVRHKAGGAAFLTLWEGLAEVLSALDSRMAIPMTEYETAERGEEWMRLNLWEMASVAAGIRYGNKTPSSPQLTKCEQIYRQQWDRLSFWQKAGIRLRRAFRRTALPSILRKEARHASK